MLRPTGSQRVGHSWETEQQVHIWERHVGQMVQAPHGAFGLWGQKCCRKKGKEKPLKLSPALTHSRWEMHVQVSPHG